MRHVEILRDEENSSMCDYLNISASFVLTDVSNYAQPATTASSLVHTGSALVTARPSGTTTASRTDGKPDMNQEHDEGPQQQHQSQSKSQQETSPSDSKTRGDSNCSTVTGRPSSSLRIFPITHHLHRLMLLYLSVTCLYF